MTALYWILAGLAAARSWRLLNTDGAGAPVRNIFHRVVVRISNSRDSGIRYRIANSLLEGFYCPFCLGFWLTTAWVGTGLAWHDTWAWQLAAGSFAVSYVVGHLGARYDGEEIIISDYDLEHDTDGEVGDDHKH